MTVRVLFHSFIGGPETRGFVLVTYAVPTDLEPYECHVCSPVIGMAVFTRSEGNWKLDASNRAVATAGGWAKPPRHVELVQVGPGRTALKIIDVGQGQGETTAVLDLLVPWNHSVELGLQRVIADDDKGMCDPDGLPCYQNRRAIRFRAHDDAEYFDIELTLTGTDLSLDDGHRRRRKVRGLEIFRFDNGTYKLLSQTGDKTFLDVQPRGKKPSTPI